MKRSTLSLITLLALLALAAFPPGDALAGKRADVNYFSIQDAQGGAFLGVTLTDVDEQIAEESGLRRPEGALVMSVFDDTPADEAGLEAGDIILSFAGEEIADAAELTKLVRAGEPGDKVKLRLRRDGRKKSIKVELGERETSITLDIDGPGSHKGRSWFGQHEPKLMKFMESTNPARLGVQVHELEGDLAGYFPGSDEGAVLVLAVDVGSAAEKAGLKAGDIITALMESDTQDIDALHKAVAKAAGEGEVELNYIRKGKQRSCRVSIEKTEHQLPRSFHDGSPGRTPRILRYHVGEDGDGGNPRELKYHEFLSDPDGLHEKMEKLEEKLERLERKLGDD